MTKRLTDEVLRDALRRAVRRWREDASDLRVARDHYRGDLPPQAYTAAADAADIHADQVDALLDESFAADEDGAASPGGGAAPSVPDRFEEGRKAGVEQAVRRVRDRQAETSARGGDTLAAIFGDLVIDIRLACRSRPAPSVPREVAPLVESARRMVAKLDRLQDALDRAPPVPGQTLLPREQRESQEHKDLRAALRLLGGADGKRARIWMDSDVTKVCASCGAECGPKVGYRHAPGCGADWKEGT